MKLTAILLLIACLQVSANSFSQVITLSERDVALETVFKKIEKQTVFLFFYTEEQLQKAKKVTIQIKNGSIEEVLDKCFAGQNLTYTIKDKVILVKEKPMNALLSQGKTRLYTLIDVKGKIIDENGEPVVASIIVKGTKNGTTSSTDGSFELKNVDENGVLIISAVSIEAKEIAINGQKVLSIVVKINATEGDIVTVNAGYYSTRKGLATGSISKVTARDIEKQPVSNPLAALQARVPGLEIVQQNGLPGGSFKVRIRGTNSIVNGNDPLYIIDGVPFTSTTLAMGETSSTLYLNGSSPLNSINPLDIESIEVLKDADATAIYGSRGANGVILITTKRGREGKTKVSLLFNSGTGKVPRKMDLLSTPQYLEMRKEAFKNAAATPTAANAPDLIVWDTTRYTDWQKELIGGNAKFTNAQLTVSGGEKSTQFSISSGYHRETTVFPSDDHDERISTSINLSNVSFKEKLRTNISINYSANNTNTLNTDLTSLALILAPDAPPLYNSQGELNWGPSAWNGFSINAHPLSYTKNIFDSKTTTLTGNIVVSYTILPHLEVKVNAGITNIGMKAITSFPISSIDPAYASVSTNSSAFANSSLRNWITEPQVSWQNKIGVGKIEILAGMSFLEQVSERLAQYGIGFSSESLMKNINSADQIFKGSSGFSQYRYQAIFGRINYSYQEKYVVNLTARRDGSSRFGPGKQFANFGAIGAAWVFSKEGFFANSFTALSHGKLRASYGRTGNDQIGDYQYLDTYSTTGSGAYMGVTGLSPQRLYNPNFAWELVKKVEAALELGFLKDRLTFSASYYRNRSSNQLVGNPLPPTTGFNTIQSNFPATVQNSGWELELNAVPVQTRNLNWSIGINFTAPKNKLVSFPNLLSSQYVTSYAVGEPLTINKQYHNTGVNPSTGIYEFEDVNKDNSYTSADRQTIMFNGRYYYAGFSNTFQYKNFQLDILFEMVKQQGFNYLLSYFATPGSQSNYPQEVMNRWQKPGDVTTIQQFTTLGTYSTAYSRLQGSDRALSDASFIRMKNISLGWSFPKNLLSKASMENAKVFIQGQNVLTITNFIGPDPESQVGVLPPLRIWTAGIQVTF